jgi:hypothetical protein
MTRRFTQLKGRFQLTSTWQRPAASSEAGMVILRPRRGVRLHFGLWRYPSSRLPQLALPSEQGIASGTSRPDAAADRWRVICPPQSVAEIRMHHVFEHFERAEPLALLIRWYDWLEPSGSLILETHRTSSAA